MKELPGAVFIIDTKKEAIAVTEAKKLGIPVVAVVDTNCDPTDITYPIPGNDDAIRAIALFVEIIANAVIDADNEVGIQIVETLTDEVPEEVEVVEEEEVVFSSDEDLSNFVATEAPKVTEEIVSDEAVTSVTDGIEVDDKTLYQD
jgi:small subunit ribosomal protein S2